MRKEMTFEEFREEQFTVNELTDIFKDISDEASPSLQNLMKQTSGSWYAEIVSRLVTKKDYKINF